MGAGVGLGGMVGIGGRVVVGGRGGDLADHLSLR